MSWNFRAKKAATQSNTFSDLLSRELAAKTASMISSNVAIKGSIKFQKELFFDGKLEGKIKSNGELTIGENADIRGEIKAKLVTVYGKVQGNITAGERCELKSTCVLQGDMKAVRLVIEEGATFIGTSHNPLASTFEKPEIARHEGPSDSSKGNQVSTTQSDLRLS